MEKIALKIKLFAVILSLIENLEDFLVIENLLTDEKELQVILKKIQREIVSTNDIKVISENLPKNKTDVSELTLKLQNLITKKVISKAKLVEILRKKYNFVIKNQKLDLAKIIESSFADMSQRDKNRFLVVLSKIAIENKNSLELEAWWDENDKRNR